MTALKKEIVDAGLALDAASAAFAGEMVGLFSSTCLGGAHAGDHVTLYSSTCISDASGDLHAGDGAKMISSTCVERL